ncbi:MAG TPA: adenylate/guanylate cyclase domain-containing protein [Acidimicrobiales bacterium]|nr:adenylate/guanylate cyclase domain-containing protein [Acidimicrobiales bacterium]
MARPDQDPRPGEAEPATVTGEVDDNLLAAGGPALVELAEDRLFGAGPRYTPEQIWSLGAVPEALARELWLAMGFPNLPDDEAALTDRDLQALRRARELLRTGAFRPEQLVQQTRLMSQAMSTITTAHVEALFTSGGATGFLTGLAGEESAEVLAVLDELLSYLYRRHLLAALERTALGDTSRDRLPEAVVGFADLTDFSATTARATEEELRVLVDQFAASAANLVASAGGRVVKLIGDEVMFSVDDPLVAADLALRLIDATSEPDLPPVHAGLALGPVLSHHGDLFGSTVNVASRLSDVARPGTVLVNDTLADALGETPGMELRRVHLRSLKGIGHVAAFKLRRRSPHP